MKDFYGWLIFGGMVFTVLWSMLGLLPVWSNFISLISGAIYILKN